ncbi:B12-binding domain-containing radical SAM protein [Paracidobacterium acidisoli]|uniref:Radical SAM protein n=1 Tax=Paracidobacterium acidisoli TaxID=2303751 RepID=A0A372ILH5_9BACT|nr:radical SAM protein [Paracidobacterium acidisoli]
MAAEIDRERTDVLFTHSYHLYYDRKQVQRQQPYPPLGTLYAAGLAREAGYSVALFDTMIDDPEHGFEEALTRYRPRLVIICEDSFNFLSKMCLSRMRDVSFNMQRQASAAGIPSVVHGSDSSDHLQAYLSHGFLAVLLGECEITILELLQAVLRDGLTSDWNITGLAYLSKPDGQIISTGPRRSSMELDQYPLPARDLASIHRYSSIWREHHGRASTNLVASRGCPFHCNWCAKPIYGNRFVLRSADSVAAEMQILKYDYSVEHLWFADDIFALNRHWVQDFADAVERRDAALPFKIQSRADLMTSETVLALKRAGCEEVWMGAESGSQAILNAMDKGLSVDSIREARARLKEAGIRAAFFLQFGYPGETLAEIEETIALVRTTQPDDIGVSVSYPLPGTVFYQRVREQLGAKRNWVDSDDLTVMFRAAYTDEFYRSLRNALHHEVEQYARPADRQDRSRSAYLWSEVYRLERRCRNAVPTQLPVLQSGMGEEPILYGIGICE